MNKFVITMLFAVALVANASESVGQLGFDVARQTAALDYKKQVKNTLTSPLSLHLALSMATNGANGETLKFLLSKLGAGDLKALNAANKSVQKLLQKSVPKDWPKWKPKPPIMSVANSAWRTNGATDNRHYEFHPDFVSAIEENYGASVGVEDFKTQEAVDKINNWVAKSTQNMITEIIDQDGLSPLLWALINAIYLEGQWAEPFFPQSAEGPNFTKLDGKQIKVPMMAKEEKFRHAVTKMGEAIEIPLAESQLAFVAVLPSMKSKFVTSKGDASTLWTEAAWSQVLESLAKSEGERGILEMPKFKYKYGYEMNPEAELTKLTGLSHIFTNEADFSNMATKGSLASKVGLIIQKTAIELDENGLKAAAVTLVGGIERTSVPLNPTFEMSLNRPFLYSIVDRETGAILFLGSVVDPTAE